jgi:hypothetical protein
MKWFTIDTKYTSILGENIIVITTYDTVLEKGSLVMRKESGQETVVTWERFPWPLSLSFYIPRDT